jgi:hypothetical protein
MLKFSFRNIFAQYFLYCISSGLVDGDAISLAAMAKKSTTLQELKYVSFVMRINLLLKRKNSLEGNKITDTGAFALADALSGNSVLQSLRFVFEILIHALVLITCSLDGNKITDTGAIALAESLMGNTTLSTLL